MNRQTSSRLPACPPPADPGSAAVVAHAAESSSGACIPPKKTFCGIDRDDWSYFGGFFLHWGLPLLLCTACLLWWFG